MFGCVIGRESDEIGYPQLHVGNLALKGSQQPSALLSIGQNVIDKGDVQAVFTSFFLIGKHKNYSEMIPGILYGARHDFSVYINVPCAARYQEGSQSSAGVADIFIQTEYSFYRYIGVDQTNAMSFVASLFLPSGSDHKEPPTGFGSPSFFFGLTASHLATDWYFFISPGLLLTTPQGQHTQAGNIYYYQAGFGRNIAYEADKWLLTWIIELSGTCEMRRKINGVTDPNTGGSTIVIGPELWFSTNELIVQGGIAPVVLEHLNGSQLKNWFLLFFSCSWTF
jgi:hypothetical protein